MLKLNWISVFSSYLLVILICCAACSKEKPKVGHYDGFFKYEGGVEKWSPLDITESSKDYILIEGSKLEKDKKEISGKMNVPGIGGSIEIQGKWSRKPFNNRYFIEGTFIQTTYYLMGGQSQSSGTFLIKSDK